MDDGNWQADNLFVNSCARVLPLFRGSAGKKSYHIPNCLNECSKLLITVVSDNINYIIKLVITLRERNDRLKTNGDFEL